jgi:hypothetical protein
MILTKEETRNLVNMLRSSDQSNGSLAMGIIDTLDHESNVGELLVLYYYGRQSAEYWEQSPKAFKIIEEYSRALPLTSGKILSILTSNGCSNASIELFFELFADSMRSVLDATGYITEVFNIEIVIKDDKTRKSKQSR